MRDFVHLLAAIAATEAGPPRGPCSGAARAPGSAGACPGRLKVTHPAIVGNGEMTAAYLPTAEDVTAAGRLADVFAAVELLGKELPLDRRDRALSDRLRIVYLVARAGLGDGERLLLTQARQLAALGADVTVLSRGHPDDADLDHRERRVGTRARMRRVPYGEAITDAVPPCDLVVAGCWEFVLPARMLGLAPVVLFERGALHVLGDVPEHIRDVVAASLRAAVARYALGSRACASLEQSYGVAAREAPAAVDLAVFNPGPRRATPGRRPRGVVVVGSDGVEADRLGDARRVVAALEESHPGLGALWVSPQRDPAQPFGEVLAAPTEAERARCYRSARVYVSTAEHEVLAMTPLEMMASGTPVVATAHPGILAYATHETNALLAPVGDVDGLVAAARRVLDDDELAARLALAGRRTAVEHSWGAVAPQLLSSYAEVVRASPLATPLAGFEVALGGARFARAGDAALLRARLGSCTTREVALPVSQPALGGWRVVRWRVVARRDEGEVGTTRVYLPVRSEHPLDDSPAQACLDLLRSGEPAKALAGLVERCERAGRAAQAVLGRWVVLAMLAAGRAGDALDLARAFAKDFPTQPDYVLLVVVAARAARRPVDVSGPLETIALLGTGARFDEWFDDPYALLGTYLGFGGPTGEDDVASGTWALRP